MTKTTKVLPDDGGYELRIGMMPPHRAKVYHPTHAPKGLPVSSAAIPTAVKEWAKGESKQYISSTRGAAKDGAD